MAQLAQPALVPPNTVVRLSFLRAMEEFRAEGRGGSGDHSNIGREIRTLGSAWRIPEKFEQYVGRLLAEALEETSRPEGLVPCTTLWYVDGSNYYGRLAIRHRLTPTLFESGGHIGYDVRPSARRRGYATAMLRAALSMAKRRGIAAVLVTCDTDNVASRRS